MKRSIPFTLLDIRLDLFGEAGGDGGAAAAAPEGAAQQQAAAALETPQQTTQQTNDTQQTQSPEDRRRAFRDMIHGEFKDLYTQETQRMIDRRLKPMREMQDRINAMQPILDVLAQRYGVDGSDPQRLAYAVQNDSALWAEEAERAGMTVQQYAHMKQLERQNAQYYAMQRDAQARAMAEQRYREWVQEGEQLKDKYPEFNLEDMQSNELFALMLRNGFPMEQAYRAAMVDDFEARAAQQAEKAVTENIRAKGARPKEAGAAQNAAAVSRPDVSKMSREDVLNVLKGIEEGKTSLFG